MSADSRPVQIPFKETSMSILTLRMQYFVDGEGRDNGGSAEADGLSIKWETREGTGGCDVESVILAAISRLNFLQDTKNSHPEYEKTLEHLTQAFESVRRSRAVPMGTEVPPLYPATLKHPDWPRAAKRQHLIVAGNFWQAATYATEKGWNRREWRYCGHKLAFLGISDTEVHFVGTHWENPHAEEVRSLARMKTFNITIVETS